VKADLHALIIFYFALIILGVIELGSFHWKSIFSCLVGVMVRKSCVGFQKSILQSFRMLYEVCVKYLFLFWDFFTL
jgi:hypothetical protein